MQYYEYKTRNPVTGKMNSGIVTADDMKGAEDVLKHRGENIIELGELRDFMNIRKTIYSVSVRANRKIKIEFFSMLKFMLESGMGLHEALVSIRDTGANKSLKRIATVMADKVRQGTKLSSAISHTRQFDEATAKQIASGEESGDVIETLERIITKMERELEFRSKLKSAMIYPIIICIVMVVVLYVMMTVVVPTLASTLVSMGGELPLITRIVIGTSDFMKKTTPYFAILLVLAVIGYRIGRRDDDFKLAADRFKIRIPIIGNMIEKTELSRFCRNLSAMQKSGITLVSSLKTVESAIKNSKIAKEIDKACRLVEISGMNLATALSKSGKFPPLMLQLIEIGINSGQICDVLDRIAEQYEKETDESLKRITSILEPAMIIVTGLVVGVIVISIMLPMMDLADTIK